MWLHGTGYSFRCRVLMLWHYSKEPFNFSASYEELFGIERPQMRLNHTSHIILMMWCLFIRQFSESTAQGLL
jgi:hypothetical protein